MQGEKIEMVDKFKFLGIWIDHHLEWNHHVQVTLNGVAQNTYMIKWLKLLLSKQLLTSLYYAHIHSHLQYGIVIWGSMLNSDQITRLNKAQQVPLSHIGNTLVLSITKTLDQCL